MNGHRISLPVIVTLSGVLSSFFVSLSEEASVADPILKGSPRVNRSVSVYTSTVNNGTFYPTLLGGSSLLDGVYESFNSTGLIEDRFHYLRAEGRAASHDHMGSGRAWATLVDRDTLSTLCQFQSIKQMRCQ